MASIRLTEEQVNKILDDIHPATLMNFFAEDVEWSVDFFCKFIREYVDSEKLQQKLRDTLNSTPIFYELFD